MNFTSSTDISCKQCGRQMTPTWSATTVCMDCQRENEQANKEWYELEENFPCLIRGKNTGIIRIATKYLKSHDCFECEGGIHALPRDFLPMSNEELTVYCKGL